MINLDQQEKAWSRLKGNYIARNGVDDDGDGLVDECDDMDGIRSWWGELKSCLGPCFYTRKRAT